MVINYQYGLAYSVITLHSEFQSTTSRRSVVVNTVNPKQPPDVRILGLLNARDILTISLSTTGHKVGSSLDIRTDGSGP